MKKLWVGASLLAFLLTAGLVNARGMDKNHRQIAALLTDAADASLAGDMRLGTELSEKAQTLWEKYRDAVATVADHQPLEDVDGLLSQLRVYAATGGVVEFAARVGMSKLVIHWIGRDALFLAEPVAWLGALLSVMLPLIGMMNSTAGVSSKYRSASAQASRGLMSAWSFFGGRPSAHAFGPVVRRTASAAASFIMGWS